MDPINDMPSLAQVMAWCWIGTKPLHEPILTNINDATWPPWVNEDICQWYFADIAKILNILQAISILSSELGLKIFVCGYPADLKRSGCVSLYINAIIYFQDFIFVPKHQMDTQSTMFLCWTGDQELPEPKVTSYIWFDKSSLGHYDLNYKIWLLHRYQSTVCAL